MLTLYIYATLLQPVASTLPVAVKWLTNSLAAGLAQVGAGGFVCGVRRAAGGGDGFNFCGGGGEEAQGVVGFRLHGVGRVGKH